jgi:hypothetical protein
MSRSPKRTALHEHRQHRGQAEQNAADARRPFDKVMDQEERASALERQRESELAQLDRQEAELIAGGEWSPDLATDEQRQVRRKAEEDLASSRRALAAVRQHGELVRVPADEAQRAAAQIGAETATFVDDVLAEEGHAALAALAAARAETVRLEATVRSISTALAARKSYRRAEVIAVAVNTMSWPDAHPNPAPYLDLAARLAVDPDAAVTP